MGQTITIGGQVVQALLSSVQFSKPANGIGQLSFEVDSVGAAYRPAMDAVVVLEDDDEGRLFGGYVDVPEESGIRGETIGADITTRVDCRHFASIVDRTLVNGTYPAGTLKSWLQQLLADAANPQTGLTLHAGQVDGPALAAVTYDYARTRDVLDDWSRLSGYVWRIDDFSRLRMIEPGSESADFDLVDGDGNTEGDVVVTPTRQEYWNRVVVRSGTITALAEDAAEIVAHGLWAQVVQAPADTTTQAAADALAAAVLAASTPILKRIVYHTFRLSLEPGQAQNIEIVDRNINNTYLITDVSGAIMANADRMRCKITAVEGLVYKTGWREQARRLFGTGGTTVAAGFVGAGSAAVRYAQYLGGHERGVRSAVPTWVNAAADRVQIDTVPRRSTSALVILRMRAFDSGVSVQARIFDVTAGAPCSGLSSVITDTDWVTETFTVTLNNGSHFYQLQLLPGAPNADVAATGHIV